MLWTQLGEQGGQKNVSTPDRRNGMCGPRDGGRKNGTSQKLLGARLLGARAERGKMKPDRSGGARAFGA